MATRYEMKMHFDNGQTLHLNVVENVIKEFGKRAEHGFEQWLRVSNSHSLHIINRDKIVRIELHQVEEDQSETEELEEEVVG